VFFEKMQEKFFSDPKTLMEVPNLLNFVAKYCKEVIRNVSITNDTHFRGQVLTKQASVFPLSHRSGHNKTGAYNTKNETLYDKFEDLS
jgi:hypothetical protein